MITSAIATAKVVHSSQPITELIADSIVSISERSVLAISSKIVSICEGSVVPTSKVSKVSKEELIIQQADYYLSAELSNYNYHITITGGSLIASAGIDLSNGDGYYILWPANPQLSANLICRFLREHYGLNEVGVIITDSSSIPLKRGTAGIYLAHSGFKALNNYTGQPDVFGRPLERTQANLAAGLAAAAVVEMGEGNEQTPLCLISDLSKVEFEDHDPSADQLAELNVSMNDDLFAPILTLADWQSAKKSP